MSQRRIFKVGPVDTGTYGTRSVYLPHGRRTSVRLEPVIWEALADIAGYKGTDRKALIQSISAARGPVRDYCLRYASMSSGSTAITSDPCRLMGAHEFIVG